MIKVRKTHGLAYAGVISKTNTWTPVIPKKQSPEPGVFLCFAWLPSARVSTGAVLLRRLTGAAETLVIARE